jgi:hypothetical protein
VERNFRVGFRELLVFGRLDRGFVNSIQVQQTGR